MTARDRTDAGPHPAVRGVLGLVVGLAAGALVALLIPRDREQARGAAAPGDGG